MDGVFVVAPSLDHVGIVSRTVDDCGIVLEVLAGNARLQSRPTEPASARLGVADEFFGDELEPDVRVVVSEALAELERLGATLVPVKLPSLRLTLPAGLTILAAEAAAVHTVGSARRPHGYVAETRRLLELGALLPAAYVESAQRARRLVCREVEAAFRDECLDALVTPTLPRTSIRRGDGDRRRCAPLHPVHDAREPDGPTGTHGSMRVHGRRPARGPSTPRTPVRGGGLARDRTRVRAGNVLERSPSRSLPVR